MAFLVEDIENTAYDNFCDAKMELRNRVEDTPDNRLIETKSKSNSKAADKQIRYIEEFCSWCDDVNVAVFWDASTHGNDVSKYFDLNDYLASKGKKAVIIGTSYNLGEDIRNS